MNNSQTQPDHHYLHTYSAGALLPLMQAVITGLIVTVAVYVLLVVFGMYWLDAGKPALVVGIVVVVWRWWVLQGHWFALTARDLVMDMADNGQLDGSYQAEAEDEPRGVIRIQLVKENGHIGESIDLPCDDEQLSLMAKGLLAGMPFTERYWTGRGKPFSSPQFRTLKDVMIKRGLAEYKHETDPRQGIRLTDEGRAVMERFAAPHSPTEAGDGGF